MKKIKQFATLLLLIVVSFPLSLQASNQALAHSALDQVGKTLIYDPRYTQLHYPMGDIPLLRGVCSDVVIRALRQQSIDLQRLVHEDMQRNFSLYPKIWGLKRTDKNIDHRRVPNLHVFFNRHGKSINISDQAKDYQAGDIVAWRLNNGRPHIGIVSVNYNKAKSRPLIVHNIGWGAREDDVLFAWQVTGHYRYFKE